MKRAAIDILFPSATERHRAAFAATFEALAAEFRLDQGPYRAEFFLAQLGHESAGLAILEERLNYRPERLLAVFPKYFKTYAEAKACAADPSKLANRVYGNRMGNGPELSGDGFRYRGRGYIQLTGRDGYRAVGRIAGIDLENKPELVTDPAHALRCACAFWEWKGLHAAADKGDFKSVTRRINGGLNGYQDRLNWLDKVRRTLRASERPPALSRKQLVSLQRALQDRGYNETGAADGLVGPRTLSAIARFRQENGLRAGGIDHAVLRALDAD
jgi:putative chitinase